MNTLLERDFGMSPTFNAYVATRDVMRQARAKWHEDYTYPGLWEFYRPSRVNHASYWFYWTLEDEISWKNNFRLWMQFVNDYKNRGGRVTVGSDSGYTYNLYGFGYVEGMELLREAGFSSLEVIHAATLQGARQLWIDDEVGSIEVGKKADFVVVKENPLQNLSVLRGTGVIRLDDDVGSIQVGKKADFVVVKENPLQNLSVLRGTGAIKLNDETGEVERVGGVVYTIKDGIVYDAKQLLRDVREIVQAEKDRLGIPSGPMPIETVPFDK